MRHATDIDLDTIEPLLKSIGALGILKERKRGIFYYKSRAFLHFHEDSGKILADIRTGADFERLPTATASDHARLLKKIVAFGDANN